MKRGGAGYGGGPAALSLCLALTSAFALAACRKDKPESAPASFTSAAPGAIAPVASGLPLEPERVASVVNPKSEPTYSGPVGAVTGLVTAKGDLPPPSTRSRSVPATCSAGREMYAKLFREGPMRSLPDVLVAVTGYDGYVPESKPTRVVEASGCAFDARTFALTFGQALEVVSKDGEAYVPNLLGQPAAAQILALPGGAGSRLYPAQPRQYLLTDDIKVFMAADVFVLKFATHDVTDLDGQFRIEGIPTGDAKINVLAPATGAMVEQHIVIEPGKTLELNFELPFDAKNWAEQQAAAAASAAAPAASAP